MHTFAPLVVFVMVLHFPVNVTNSLLMPELLFFLVILLVIRVINCLIWKATEFTLHKISFFMKQFFHLLLLLILTMFLICFMIMFFPNKFPQIIPLLRFLPWCQINLINHPIPKLHLGLHHHQIPTVLPASLNSPHIYPITIVTWLKVLHLLHLPPTLSCIPFRPF